MRESEGTGASGDLCSHTESLELGLQRGKLRNESMQEREEGESVTP